MDVFPQYGDPNFPYLLSGSIASGQIATLPTSLFPVVCGSIPSGQLFVSHIPYGGLASGTCASNQISNLGHGYLSGGGSAGPLSWLYDNVNAIIPPPQQNPFYAKARDW